MSKRPQLARYSILEKLQLLLKNTNGRLVLVGLLVGFCYLPVWLAGLLERSAQNTGGFTLATCFIGLSAYLFWKEHKSLAALKAQKIDRRLGQVLLIIGISLFPFSRFALWPQAILWALILAGIACCTWGTRLFVQHKMLVFITLLTVYPRPTVVTRNLWEALTPYKLLEQWMAQVSAGALTLVGWPATAEQTLVIFPEGAVDVDWNCNGFDMALTMVVAGLIMGALLKQNWQRTVLFIGVGALAALAFNVPRIMLLAVAAVYWGNASFNFWHGPWGGQIFTGILFTVYYYAVIGTASSQPKGER